jgi:hypothetical protein
MKQAKMLTPNPTQKPALFGSALNVKMNFRLALSRNQAGWCGSAPGLNAEKIILV